ncbi:hypothetical protein HOK51_04985 [Candidatus Woesearchaeota archaeon]|jgi:hypothetical protein|nr:hypothetical protein [Candidatus Woesearchaeota archaeon]MBT6519181.1 hypothetical protein [Candidatus Woesearchaeota archaeon]MBT7368678.1 hypothetical protein [Candidatus Woesearchaeota archaeon]
MEKNKYEKMGYVSICAAVVGLLLPIGWCGWCVSEIVKERQLWKNGGPKIEQVLVRESKSHENELLVYEIKRKPSEKYAKDAEDICYRLNSKDFSTFKSGLDRVRLVGTVDKWRVSVKQLDKDEKSYVEAFRHDSKRPNNRDLTSLIVYENPADDITCRVYEF